MRFSFRMGLMMALIFPLCLSAQTSMGLRTQVSQSAAQHWQPAYLYQQDFQWFQWGIDGDYVLAANTLAYADANLNGYIDEAQKTRILNALGPDNRLRAGFTAGAMLNFKVGNQPLSLSYRRNQSVSIRFNNPEGVGLLLRGNAPYAGTEVIDEDVSYQNLLYSQVGLGTAFALGKLQIGTRVNLLLGHSLRHLQHLDYRFFTEADGTEIQVRADYEWFRDAPDQNLFYGLSADIGLVYPLSEKWELNASFLDLGGINWQGTLYRNEVDFTYSGIEIANIFDFSGSELTEIFTIDTLQTLFYPDSSQGRYRLNLPPTAQIGFRFQPDSLQTLWGNLQYGFTPFAEANFRPILAFGYQRLVAKQLRLGTQVSLGGLEGFGWGVNAAWDIPLQSHQGLSLYYGFENTMGVLAPSVGRSVRMHGGLSLSL